MAFAASLSACNFPTGPAMGLTLEAVQQTMAAVTPLATNALQVTREQARDTDSGESRRAFPPSPTLVRRRLVGARMVE